VCLVNGEVRSGVSPPERLHQASSVIGTILPDQSRSGGDGPGRGAPGSRPGDGSRRRQPECTPSATPPSAARSKQECSRPEGRVRTGCRVSDLAGMLGPWHTRRPSMTGIRAVPNRSMSSSRRCPPRRAAEIDDFIEERLANQLAGEPAATPPAASAQSFPAATSSARRPSAC
jgi:hypothetical protein